MKVIYVNLKDLNFEALKLCISTNILHGYLLFPVSVIEGSGYRKRSVNLCLALTMIVYYYSILRI